MGVGVEVVTNFMAGGRLDTMITGRIGPVLSGCFRQDRLDEGAEVFADALRLSGWAGILEFLCLGADLVPNALLTGILGLAGRRGGSKGSGRQQGMEDRVKA